MRNTERQEPHSEQGEMGKHTMQDFLFLPFLLAVLGIMLMALSLTWVLFQPQNP